MTGFVAAGGIAAVVLQHSAIESGVVVLGIYFIAGIIGAVLFLLLFNAALIVPLVSGRSVSRRPRGGAAAAHLAAAPETALVIVLAVVGIAAQAETVAVAESSP